MGCMWLTAVLQMTWCKKVVNVAPSLRFSIDKLQEMQSYSSYRAVAQTYFKQ